MRLDEFTHKTFAERLNDTFTVTIDPSTTVPVTLIEAIDFGALPTPARQTGGVAQGGERFSILFRGPQERPLPQGTYAFEHPHLGTFPLFIVPVGADYQGLRYEAVFTRLSRPAEPTP